MHRFNRRDFLKSAGAIAAFAAIPRAVSAAVTSPRVVVVGGGFGGATVAKYLRMWGGNVQVTLVDTNPNHISCILSNLVVTGALSMSRITLGFDTLRTTHGVSFLQGKALAVDPAGNRLTVQTAGGNQILDYDHLVLHRQSADGADRGRKPDS